jgi:hypothetical protein
MEKIIMRLKPLGLALAILAGSSSAFAASHSDYTKSFPLHTLKTFQFKQQHRISRDPLANNEIWASDMRDAIRSDLTSRGLAEATNGNPDFYVAFYVGLQDRHQLGRLRSAVPSGIPFRLVGLAARLQRVGDTVHGDHRHR